MNRPNKAKIKRAIYVTSHGYPAVYTLIVKSQLEDGFVPTYDFTALDGTELETVAAANALVRAMREHVEAVWRKDYADGERARRIAEAKRS